MLEQIDYEEAGDEGAELRGGGCEELFQVANVCTTSETV
jgi:hypothetical protein